MMYQTNEKVEFTQNCVKRSALYEGCVRLIDIVLSLLAIVLTFPLLLAVGILMKIEEPKAPFLFHQIRVGRNGSPFMMYKIRSMRVDAEELLAQLKAKNEMSGHMFKMAEDPRITKIGKFIRKTSIDEFPQFFNVLKGDMSLVGPRPALPTEVAEYSSHDEKRLYVKPGCTGLWQVSGRNQLSFQEMIELDHHYIRNRSLTFNIVILFRTVKEILIDKRGY